MHKMFRFVVILCLAVIGIVFIGCTIGSIGKQAQICKVHIGNALDLFAVLGKGQLSGRVLSALRILCNARILTVGPGLKSGIKLRLDNPAQLGAELLCGTVRFERVGKDGKKCSVKQ